MRTPEHRLMNSRLRDRLMTEKLTAEHHFRLTERVNHRYVRTKLRHLTRTMIIGDILDREYERLNKSRQ